MSDQVKGAYDVQTIFEEFVYRVLARMEIYSIAGVVSDIDETQRICTVTPVDDSAAINGVRLQASLSPQTGSPNNGLVHIPKDNSFVVVTFLNKDTGFISLMTEIEKTIQVNEDDGSYKLTIQNMSFAMDKSGVVFNGGNNGGIPITANVVKQLNTLQKDINNLKTLIAGVIGGAIIPTAAPAAPDALQIALKAALASWYGSQLSITTDSDIKNDNVKQ